MNVQHALDDPASVFSTPADVVQSAQVSRALKIEILRRWEYEARSLEVAQEENMMGGTGSRLAEVLDALHALGETSLSGATNKQGAAPEETPQ